MRPLPAVSSETFVLFSLGCVILLLLPSEAGSKYYQMHLLSFLTEMDDREGRRQPLSRNYPLTRDHYSFCQQRRCLWLLLPVPVCRLLKKCSSLSAQAQSGLSRVFLYLLVWCQLVSMGIKMTAWWELRMQVNDCVLWQLWMNPQDSKVMAD